MCIEVTHINNNNNMSNAKMESKKKVSYSVKKLLKHLFRHQQKQTEIAQNMENTKKAESLDSLESIENLRNADLESTCSSIESYENDANERLSASYEIEDYDMAEVLATVPIHYVRNEHGTFFWTAVADLPADNDLIEPLHCCTTNQIAVAIPQDRWAQA